MNHGRIIPPPHTPVWARYALCLLGVLQVSVGLFLVRLAVLLVDGGFGKPGPDAGGAFLAAACGACGVALTIFGIGSLLGRRWARSLVAAASLNGLLLACSMAVGDGSQTWADWMATGIFGLACMAVYGTYSSDGVRLTCEARNPHPAWTDRCPIPVLAWSMTCWAGGIIWMVDAVIVPVAPVFGSILVGAPAAVMNFVVSGLFFWCAVASFRLRDRAWWVSIMLCTFLSTSAALTDPSEWLRALGLSSSEVHRFGLTDAFRYLLEIVWLLYLRRFFFGSRVSLTHRTP